jgi:predicted aconitase with swiveling domain
MKRIGEFLVAGQAEGPALVLSEALSFWGGIDLDTGDIIDNSHPDLGKNVKGRILVMISGRGSSSSSSVLAEAIRRGTGPAALILTKPDPILAVGAIVAEFLYGVCIPIVVGDIDGIGSDHMVRITAAKSGQAIVQAGALGAG